LRNYTLGPPVETYGPNLRIAAIVVVLGLLFCWLAFAVAIDTRDRTAWAVFLGLTAGFAALALRPLLSRVWMHEMGISFRGILGYGEMRWQEVERLYFGSYEMHAHYFPLGTFYRLKLISSHGEKVSLGERVRRADELAERIGKFTMERLLQKAVQEFNSGATVDFGAILVTRAEGVTLRKWYTDKKIRWDEIAGYDFTSSDLRFHRFGKRLSVNVAADRVANVRVLRALLDTVMERAWQR
jgi:hypothetical protein